MHVTLIIFLLDSTATEQRGRQSKRDREHSGQGTDHKLICRLSNWCFGKLNSELTESPTFGPQRDWPPSLPFRGSSSKDLDSFIYQAQSRLQDGAPCRRHSLWILGARNVQEKRDRGVWRLRLNNKTPRDQKVSDRGSGID